MIRGREGGFGPEVIRVQSKNIQVPEVETVTRYGAAGPGRGTGGVNLDQIHKEGDDGGKIFSSNSDTIEGSKDADRNPLGGDKRSYKVIVNHVLLINVLTETPTLSLKLMTRLMGS